LEYLVEGDFMESYIIKRRRYASETLIVHGGNWTWDGGSISGQSVSERRAMHQMLSDVQYTRTLWPDPPPDALINQYINTVNVTVFDDKYPIESNLFTGAEPTPYYDGHGHRCWDIKYNFLHRYGTRQATWNKLWNVADKTYTGITPKPYDQVDH